MASSAISELTSAYKAWGRGKGASGEPFISLMAEDGTFRSIAGGAKEMMFTRTHSTQEKVRAYFKGLAEDWDMVFYNVRLFLVSGNTVAVVCECSWKQKHTGRIVHTPKLDIVRMKRGRIADFFEFFDNHQAISACTACGDGAAQKEPKPHYSDARAKVISESTPATKANLRTMKKLYAGWIGTKGGTAESVIAELAPKVSWGSLSAGAGPVAFTKMRKSREEAAAYFRELAENITILEYKIDEYVAAGAFVLALGHGKFIYKPTGKTIETPKADLWRFSRGKITEFYEYYDTAAVMAAAS
ncbi:hypothetical protein BH10PSE7_BH10PSE7_31370 [soil metagenome]